MFHFEPHYGVRIVTFCTHCEFMYVSFRDVLELSEIWDVGDVTTVSLYATGPTSFVDLE